MSTIDKIPLEKRKVAKEVLAGVIKWYFLLAVILVADRYTSFPIDIPAGYYGTAIIAIFILEIIYQSMAHKRHFYDLSDYLVLREGIISRIEKTIPYSRIHDVYVDQDIFDRIFQLWDIHFTTLDRKKHHHIDGLSGRSAKALRDMILRKI